MVADAVSLKEETPWQLAQVFVFSAMPDLVGSSEQTSAAGGAEGFPPIVSRVSARLSAEHPLVGPVVLSDVVMQGEQLHAMIQFDQHQFRLIGQTGSAQDESVERAIECSHWDLSAKQSLREHRAHWVCYYLGEHDDPAERIIATHRLAAALVPEGLIGVIDPEAWNCLPAAVLTDITKAATLETFRNAAPAGLWTGFVKMLVSEQDIWFCTKGLHRWGRPDFAMAGNNDQSQQVSEIFFALLNYSIAAPEAFQVGQTAEFGPDLNLAFDAVTEYADYLNSPCGTLVVRRLDTA